MGPITRIAAGIREREYCSTLERSGSGPCSGDGSADGVYLGEHLLAFDFISNVLAYPDLPGWSQPPTVRLSAGKVASVSVHGDGDNSFFDIRGFDAFFHQGEQHADLITATGTLVPVPEPDTDALLLAGLALVGIVVPRRRSAVSRRRRRFLTRRAETSARRRRCAQRRFRHARERRRYYAGAAGWPR